MNHIRSLIYLVLVIKDHRNSLSSFCTECANTLPLSNCILFKCVECNYDLYNSMHSEVRFRAILIELHLKSDPMTRSPEQLW